MMMRQVWMMTITKEAMSCTEQLLVDAHFFIHIYSCQLATTYELHIRALLINMLL